MTCVALQRVLPSSNVVFAHGTACHLFQLLLLEYSVYWPHLDVSLLYSSLAGRANWSVYDNTMGSDQSPTVTWLFDQPLPAEFIGPPRFQLDKADWSRFKENCRSLLKTDALVCDSIDTYSERLTGCIIPAAEASIPQRKANARRRKPLPYWNNACSIVIASKLTRSI